MTRHRTASGNCEADQGSLEHGEAPETIDEIAARLGLPLIDQEDASSSAEEERQEYDNPDASVASPDAEPAGVSEDETQPNNSESRRHGHVPPDEEPETQAPEGARSEGDSYQVPEWLVDADMPIPIEWVDKAPPESPQLLTTVTGADFLPCGCFAMLIGGDGIGKTTSVLQMACALAAGVPWLGPEGFHPPKPVKVLLLLAEEDKAEAQRRVHRIFYDMALDRDRVVAAVQRMHVVGLRAKDVALFATQGTERSPKRTKKFDELRAFLDRHGFGFVFLDPYSRFGGIPDMNANESATVVVQGMEALTLSRGRPVVLLAVHTSKVDRARGADVSMPRGASSLRDGCRFAIALAAAKDGTIRLVHAKAHSTAKVTPMRLAQGPSGLLRYDGPDLDEDGKVSGAFRNGMKILDALADGPLNTSALRRAIGNVNNKTFEAAINWVRTHPQRGTLIKYLEGRGVMYRLDPPDSAVETEVPDDQGDMPW